MTLEVSLRHRFADFLLDVAFDAPAGVTALFGRSGSGKTSVVNCVAGLLRPERGRVRLDGDVLVDTEAGVWRAPHTRRIGYVFQEGRLFPHMSVEQNLRYGARFSRGSDGTSYDRVSELLGIGALLSRRPGALSGGEKQRVAIGRALLAAPRLLLMDEPLAALDDPRKAEILPYLERLRDETEIPILYVSHAMAEVARLATTLVLLEEGCVVQAGPAAAVLADPETVTTLGIREAGAIVTGVIRAHHGDGLTEIAVSGGALFLPRTSGHAGDDVRIRIEAHDVILATERPEGLSALNILSADVTALREGGGPGVMVQLRVGTDLILARVTRRSAHLLDLSPGMRCYAIVKAVSVAQGDVGVVGPS